MSAILSRSNKPEKKWKIVFDKKTIHFGDSRYKDYTQHKNKERKKRYLLRHSKREDWKNPYTSGFWSRWLLWNKPTLTSSKRDISKRFGISF